MSLKKKPILWVNVTTSARWNRPPVGIVRVERAVTEHLQKLLGPDQCRLCIWQDDRFVEWVGTTAPEAQDKFDQAVDLILPRTAAFDLARPYVARALRRYSAERTDAGNTQVVASIPHTKAPQMQPARGDFVLTMGLDWDNGYVHRFHSLSRRDGLRFIAFCHDLIPVLFPQYCVSEVAKGFTEYFCQLSWGSVAVLCNSKQTLRDYNRLCHELGAPERRTAVVTLGDNIPAQRGKVGMEVEAVTRRPFILFVSTIERRKNHEVLYRAYHLLARRGLRDKLPTLLFVGMAGWGVGDLLKDIELDPFTKGLITQLNHVTDGELNHLYSKAEFCVYPSLYEGWGLPVGEALAMGKAVMCSTEGSLPEVGGDLVRYVPPWDAYAWADALQDWIENPSHRAEVEQRVVREYRPRQWSDAARVIADLVQELTETPPLPIELKAGYDFSTEAGLHFGPSLKANGVGGLLSFGPHWRLSAGNYEVQIFGAVEEPTRESVLFEVVSAHGKQMHAELRVMLPKDAESAMILRMRFNLAREVEDLELRCFVESGSSLRLDRVLITPETVPVTTALHAGTVSA